MRVGAETTHLWACANQMESMNALFLKQDCFGLNQVTLPWVLILKRTMHLPLLRDRETLADMDSVIYFFGENPLQGTNLRSKFSLHRCKKLFSIQYLASYNLHEKIMRSFKQCSRGFFCTIAYPTMSFFDNSLLDLNF